LAEDVGEKTEAATPKRREQARARGQHAASRDLSSAIILFASIIGFQMYGETFLSYSADVIRYCFETPWLDLDVERVRIELTKLVIWGVSELWTWWAIMVATTLVIAFWQTGGVHVAGEKSYFDLARLNPISGLGRIFSTRSLVKAAFDIAKVTVISLIAYQYLSERMPALAMMSRLPFPTLGAHALSESLSLSYYMATVLLVLALADFFYQRFQFERDMKMTKQQVKDEARDMDGNPEIKSRRRQVARQLARQRMMKEVPQAEVVITNPTELAVALKYKVEEMDAPVVVAMGAGALAKRIRELAIEHRIPIIENKPLAQLLFHSAEVGRVIPENTFIAVAEIMAYVYQITKRVVPPRRRA
jgi:flagellar biosynthetic protein FlhB